MIKKAKQTPTYNPERIKELVERLTTPRPQRLAGVRSRISRRTENTAGRLSTRLAKVKDWPRNYRG